MPFNGKDKKKRFHRGHPWSDKELADLQKMYPSRTNGALELHFGRSWQSILSKANQLGLKKPKNRNRKRRPWSDLEIGLLRALYPDTPREEIADQLIGRSLHAVQGMAHILGLSRMNPWTEEEVALLRQLWPDRTLSELAGILERSQRAVKSKARKLGLRRRPIVDADSGDNDEAIASRERRSKRPASRPWSEEEVKHLKHVYRTSSPKEIARDLNNRSAASIRGKAWELGLTQSLAWTAEEDSFIRENYLCLP